MTGRCERGNDRNREDQLSSSVDVDVSGFPNTTLLSSTRDLLLSNTVCTHRRTQIGGLTIA
jgi:hypothetical protein